MDKKTNALYPLPLRVRWHRIARSRNARLNQALGHARKVLMALECLKEHPANDQWQDGRNALEQLTQCYHEASAYNNSLNSLTMEETT